MYRFLLSRRWLGLLAAAVLFAAACAGLSDWQWHRLEGKHHRNALIRANLHTTPQPAARALAVGRDPAAAREWSPVTATGRWDADHQLLVRLRPYQGEVGYYVLTPLVTDAGPAVLVNRGWVPMGQTGDGSPRVAAPSAGTVTVTGRLRPAEDPAPQAHPPAGQVTRVDVPRIAAGLPYPVYGGFLELTRQVPPTSRGAHAPRKIPPPEPSEGPHLLYAVQWILFGVFALGGFVLLARREAADRRAEAAGIPRPVRSRPPRTPPPPRWDAEKVRQR